MAHFCYLFKLPVRDGLSLDAYNFQQHAKIGFLVQRHTLLRQTASALLAGSLAGRGTIRSRRTVSNGSANESRNEAHQEPDLVELRSKHLGPALIFPS